MLYYTRATKPRQVCLRPWSIDGILEICEIISFSCILFLEIVFYISLLYIYYFTGFVSGRHCILTWMIMVISGNVYRCCVD
ncbi:hypothetical protein M6B38_129875 [Iris pallida]|uniref:Uncharacterized protein n=1 Tax=Iris pallida TaxID=29817 RepID=A0AAX6G7G1_IRIPA|nr:hypothetical protein M6B38_129875 [Iris pallida]